MTTEELALEVERLRGVLARIESLVWYEPQDDDDTVESVRAMVRERDEARAEIERLKDRCASYSEDVESLNGCVSRLESALYEARDEAAKLRDERRMFRRRLVECLPWVGCTPYPNTPGFSEMIACRDLAKDTLEEVPE